MLILDKIQLIGMLKNRGNPLGAKNNDSHPQKQAIVKFYTVGISKAR